jgi:lipopolysaccharide transport system ATP-binding protein
MSDIAIKFENISKLYRLGEIGTGTLSHDLNRWWYKLRGLEDPYLKIGETNDRSLKGQSDYILALRDINLEVKKGEVLGIIGKNGAGKSTLLKILSKVTRPTAGIIKSNGRIASLLEVGTGFHPEMTGRENVYMNGSIMGMTKSEIKKKFDEIVSFSGVERYIDTPVKRYSSGMTVRLGFAVAGHLDPEILVVDEVLAVGDAEFQKKAVGKMQDISHQQGRTVLFVSHNMGAVANLCTRSIILQNGSILSSGNTNDIIDKYISLGNSFSGEILENDIKYRQKCPNAYFNAVRMVSQGKVKDSFGISEEIKIELEYTVIIDNTKLSISIHLLDNTGTCILATGNLDSANLGKDSFVSKSLKIGCYKTSCTIPPNFLNDKHYKISAFLVPENIHEMAIAEEVLSFSVIETGEMRKDFMGVWIGQIRPKMAWHTEYL